MRRNALRIGFGAIKHIGISKQVVLAYDHKDAAGDKRANIR